MSFSARTTGIAFVFAACISAAAAIGGEFGGASAAPPEAPPAPAAPALAIDAADPGVAAVLTAQAAPPSHLYARDKTAIELLEDFAQAGGLHMGWNSERRRFFSAQFAAFNTDDPAADRDFLVKREIAAKNAVLMAKADIIRFAATEMSASDQFEMQETDVYAQLGQEYDHYLQRLQSQQIEISRLLELTNQAEAEALAGATARDRINALLDAAIRSLAADFDAGRIAADRREAFDRQRAAYLEAQAQYNDLLAQAENIKGQAIASSSSMVSLMSRMPLVGATVIQQAESWTPARRQYEVAVLVCWSPQLELAARATLNGAVAELRGSIGQQTIATWLDGQDLGAMVGPRQFLDDQGRRYFLGIAARPASDDAIIDRRNRSLADANAMQMAIFALMADVRAATTATQATRTSAAGDFSQRTLTEVAESLQESLSQQVANMQLHGLQPLRRGRVQHALAGVRMHVSVYGINAQDAAAAMQMQEDNVRAAIAIGRSQAWRQGRQGELNRQAEAAAHGDAAARAAGAASIREAANQPNALSRTPPAPEADAGAQRAPTPLPSSTPGAAMGGGVADDY